MPPLLSAQKISKSFATDCLFSQTDLTICEGDRIGLIGPNGSGKSTLLKILAGLEPPDSGLLAPRRGLKVGYLAQSSEFPPLFPLEILIQSAPEHLADYEKTQLAELWHSKFSFPSTPAPLLSGGWKKRLALASCLIASCDLLLLDEPTNHLDLDGILQLEALLSQEVPTFLLISHDRAFLDATVNQVIELSPAYPKGLFSFKGGYTPFLQTKEAFLSGQLSEEQSLASKARREAEWLLRGAKARTTKSSSRIEGAQTLFETLAKTRQRNRSPKAAISFLSSQRETRKLLSVKNLGKLPLFSQLEFTLSPGTRLALLGPNGSGKTTLLRLLAGELSADQGTIKRADNLQIAYFDQHRSALPLTLTLQEALSPEGQYVTYQGNLVHINTWCKRFLFSPDRLPTPLSRLSGGERARIALAHLMLKPADLLLLDEPTNDLDIPTLEVLEESLLQFPGAVVLISHDRRLLERTCNSFVSLAPAPSAPKPSPRADPVVRSPAPFDFRKLERQIDKLESELKALTDSLETASDVPVTCRAIDLLQTKIDQLYSQLQ